MNNREREYDDRIGTSILAPSRYDRKERTMKTVIRTPRMSIRELKVSLKMQAKHARESKRGN